MSLAARFLLKPKAELKVIGPSLLSIWRLAKAGLFQGGFFSDDGCQTVVYTGEVGERNRVESKDRMYPRGGKERKRKKNQSQYETRVDRMAKVMRKVDVMSCL